MNMFKIVKAPPQKKNGKQPERIVDFLNVYVRIVILAYTLHSIKSERKMKIIWFNPPYSENIKTNVGKCALARVLNTFSKTTLHQTLEKYLLNTFSKTTLHQALFTKYSTETHSKSGIVVSKHDTNNKNAQQKINHQIPHWTKH